MRNGKKPQEAAALDKRRRTTFAKPRRQRAIDSVSGSNSAEDLLTGVPCPPTDLNQILPRLNVTGHEGREEFVGSGRCYGTAMVSRSFIPLECRLDEDVGRWHTSWLMHYLKRPAVTAPRTGCELERLCDMIATEILMPWKHFARRIRENVCLENILHLARIFQTSVSATAIRCVEVCGVSAFEIESNQLRWGCGAVRSRYDITSEASLARAVTSSAHSDSGGDQIDMSLGNHAVPVGH